MPRPQVDKRPETGCLAGEEIITPRPQGMNCKYASLEVSQDAPEHDGLVPQEQDDDSCCAPDASVRSSCWRCSVLVIVASAAVCCAAPFTVDNLTSQIRQATMDLPADSPAVLANAFADEHFPNRPVWPVVLAIEAMEGTETVLTDVVRDYTQNFARLCKVDWRMREFRPFVLGYYTNDNNSALEPFLRKAFVSSDERMTIVVVQATHDGLWWGLPSFGDFFCEHQPPGYTVLFGGFPLAHWEGGCAPGSGSTSTASTVHALMKAEMVTSPAVVIIMAYLVQEVRLLILVPLVLVVSYVVSAAVVSQLAMSFCITSDVPPAMASVGIALCLDYSLFFLCRFNDQQAQSWPLQRNIDTLLRCTGQTIFISGVLIATAFFGALTLPQGDFRGAGMAMGTATMACVLICLTLTPSLLIVGGKALTRLDHAHDCFNWLLMKASFARDESPTSVRWSRPRKVRGNFWLRLAETVEKCPLGFVFLVLLVLSPVLWQVRNLHINADYFAIRSIHAPSTVAMRRINQYFPVGFMDPFFVTVSAPVEAINATVEESVRKEARSAGLGEDDSSTLADLAAEVAEGKQPDKDKIVSALQTGLMKRPPDERAVGIEALVNISRIARDPDAGKKEIVSVILGALSAIHGLKGQTEEDPMDTFDKRLQKIKEKIFESQGLLGLHTSGSAAVAMMNGLTASAVAPVARPGDYYPPSAKVRVATPAPPEGDPNSADNIMVDVVGTTSALHDRGNGPLLAPVGFDAMHDLNLALLKVGNVSMMLGPSWTIDRPLDWSMAALLGLNATRRRNPEVCAAYDVLLDTFVNGSTALFMIHTTFPGLGGSAGVWAEQARVVIAEWQERHPGFKAMLSGGATQLIDARTYLLQSMCNYLIFSVVVIVLVVFLSFGSLVLAIRLSLALLFTLLATAGFAVLLYQTTVLHGVFPWIADYYGITYQVVPLACCLAIALGMDYDIFLVSRIAEFRARGCSDRSAIIQGVTKTGGIISGAGVIMSLAFSGLCFTDKLVLNQFGTLMIVSVLLDTFVVRTVLVPALMLSAKDTNWWPRRMPPIVEGLEGDLMPANDDTEPSVDGPQHGTKSSGMATHGYAAAQLEDPSSGMLLETAASKVFSPLVLPPL